MHTRTQLQGKHQTQLQLQGTLIQTQHQVHKTRSQMQQTEMTKLRETNHRRQTQMVETLSSDQRQEVKMVIVMRMRSRPGPDARVPDYQEASRDADSRI
ncbi:hypothetical protein Tco_1186380 [Tanacetum coccineum]